MLSNIMKYVFIRDFLTAVRADKGEDFYAVGEYWNGDDDNKRM